MTTAVPRSVSIGLRLAPLVIAAVCALALPATSAAAWDRDEFDACTTRADTAWFEGDISNAEHLYFYELCCGRSGGAWTPHGNQGLGVCGAPALAADTTAPAPPSEAANPDVPAEPASTPKPTPTKQPRNSIPRTSLTLSPDAPIG